MFIGGGSSLLRWGLAMLTHDFESSWQTGWCRLIPDDFIRMSEVSAGRVEMDGVAGTLLPLMPDTPGRPSSLRRLAQLIPKMSVFWPGESQGWGSLVGCHLWGHTGSDTTEATRQQQQRHIGSTVF